MNFLDTLSTFIFDTIIYIYLILLLAILLVALFLFLPCLPSYITWLQGGINYWISKILFYLNFFHVYIFITYK